jgi:ribosomal protein S18 acetylase RimI-like enzyme
MRLTISPANHNERTAACRVLFGHLADADRAERAACCRDLLASGELDPAGLFVARDERGAIRAAMLVQPLSGALGLAWPPRAEPGADRTAVEDAVVAAACGWLRSRGVKVCQVFVVDHDGAAPLERYGFRHVTQVVHMRRGIDQDRDRTDGPQSVTIRPAADAPPEVFADVLLRTYDGSLDCPELTGTRTAAEVLDGHRPSAGLPTERLWFLARHAGEAAGVVLFDAGTEPGALELAYLGLVPAARGRGLGGELVRYAVGHAAADGCHTLTLSVDARNGPAARLYHRHGFWEYDRREVWLAAWSATP